MGSLLLALSPTALFVVIAASVCGALLVAAAVCAALARYGGPQKSGKKGRRKK